MPVNRLHVGRRGGRLHFTQTEAPYSTPEASFRSVTGASSSPIVIPGYLVQGVNSLTNPMLVVFVFRDAASGGVVSSITWNGYSLTSGQVQADAGTGFTRVEIWYLANPIPGTGSVICTATGTITRLVAAALFGGIADAAPEATAGQEGAAGTGLTTSIVTVSDGALIVDMYGTADSAPTADVAQTSLYGQSVVNGGAGISYMYGGSAGSHDMTWSHSLSDRRAHALLAFAVA